MTDHPATPPSGGDLYARIIACMQAHPSGNMTDRFVEACKTNGIHTISHDSKEQES